jgi:hypothetical protein
MAEVMFFPNISELPEIQEPEINFEEEHYRQAALIERWAMLGSEIKRRFGPVPIDIALELSDLLRESGD